ncbi:hypothetical protein [Priestia megaterium]|uniref:hypothetical protein n=1 Tax=Priestia megaterium TaxID=1404 RepID=UPI002E1E0BEE|nr:hypothetical protein [Priestia megaterium]
MYRLKMYLVLLSFVLLFLQGCDIEVAKPLEGKYCTNGGRDTNAELGKECRYAILAGYDDADHYTNLISDLYDNEKRVSIVAPIYSFEETKNFVYMISKKEYLIFDKGNDKLERDIQKASLSKTQKEIFKHLEKEKKDRIRKVKEEVR